MHSLKYDGVYLYASDAFTDANAGIDGRMTYYYSERPHSSLGNNRTTAEVYADWLHNMLKPDYTLDNCHVVPRMGSTSIFGSKCLLVDAALN